MEKGKTNRGKREDIAVGDRLWAMGKAAHSWKLSAKIIKCYLTTHSLRSFEAQSTQRKEICSPQARKGHRGYLAYPDTREISVSG